MSNGKIAKFVLQRDARGEGRVYKVTPPLEGNKYVWVSAVVAMFTGPETYIFGCDKDGEVKNFSELQGSYRGGLNHEEALSNAGYQVQE
jgi:hypothetical protein